jgi:hypothetical protein
VPIKLARASTETVMTILPKTLPIYMNELLYPERAVGERKRSGGAAEAQTEGNNLKNIIICWNKKITFYFETYYNHQMMHPV